MQAERLIELIERLWPKGLWDPKPNVIAALSDVVKDAKTEKPAQERLDELNESIEELQSRAEELESAIEEAAEEAKEAEHQKALEDAHEEGRREAEEEGLAEVHDWLAKFARHTPDCFSGFVTGTSLDPNCTCGFNDVATELERW